MANTSTKKNTGENDAVNTKSEIVPEETSAEKKSAKEKIVPKEIDSSQYVIVRNGFHGKLIYKSRRSGEIFSWDSFGDEQEISLRELRNAKSSSKKFFVNNWFMFDEDWIIDYLGVGKYYQNSVSIDDYDKIFEKSAAELEEALSQMSAGQKHSLAYRAKTLIENGEIDSLSVISVLEKSLGTELIER